MSKYDTQGFRLDINIHEKDTILNVPFYSAYYIYQNDQNFLKIKNFALKEDLGNGIHINYDKPFLNFHTDNFLGKWFKKIYNDWIGYIPIVSSVRSGIELTEGLIQRHEEQIIDNGVDLVLDTITLGYGKFVTKTEKSATNLLSKEIKKFGIKQINDKNKFKKMLKKEFQKRLLKKIKEKKVQWFKNKLKKYFIEQNPIIINLDEHHKLNILQKPKPPYNNINNTDSVVIVERQGTISELKDIKQLSNI
ncbi:hypothetical protein ['Camptotheca acuminata' phytoplasma]|uniref:hypothetical protein n=1 Tax='Camptotheca acuminata' phytoplasma TaxID=3239192 RepID=UPI003519E6A7